MDPAVQLKEIMIYIWIYIYICSILVSDFDGSKYLLCGLGDGSLLSYNIDSRNETKDRKKLILGTKPVNLRSFRWVLRFMPICIVTPMLIDFFLVSGTVVMLTSLLPQIARRSSIAQMASWCFPISTKEKWIISHLSARKATLTRSCLWSQTPWK